MWLVAAQEMRRAAPVVSLKGHAMKPGVRVVPIFVLVLAFSSAIAAAQQQTGMPVDAFDSLQSLLTPNERLIVRDRSGKKIKGRLVSLSSDTLEITRRRWNWRTEQRTWKEDQVVRIEHQDSAWNGEALGAAAGLATLVFMVKSPSCSWACLPWAVAAVPMGMGIGGAIDLATNRTLFEAPVTRSSTVPSTGHISARLAISYRWSFAGVRR